MLVTFGKLSVNFRRPEMIDYYIFNTIYIQRKLSQACSEYFSQAINSLITGWTVYTKNINPLVLRIDLGLYIFPYRQSNQLLRRYDRQ